MFSKPSCSEWSKVHREFRPVAKNETDTFDFFTWSGEKFVKRAICVSISTRVTILISGDEGSLEGENYKSAMTANNRKFTCFRRWIRAISHFLFPVRRDLERTCSLVTHTLTRSLHVCMSDHTGSLNAVLDNRKITCIYAVLDNKIIICIYLCSCVFMSRFGRDLNPIRDG